ncbi:MAG: hypothetical protein ACI4JM_07675 [Oscillospiraceae bacterium]
MQLENELCIVQITTDTVYTVQSSDNKHYDLELNPEKYTHSDFYKTFSIHIDLFYKEIDIALVGDYYSCDTDCAILNDNILTIMQGNTISQIDIKKEELVLHKKFECFGCTLGIFPILDGFIVWGEIEILRLDLNFDKVWSFCGKDIFVSQSQNAPFMICGNSIKLFDWENNYCVLDFNGKLINTNTKHQ